MSAVAASLRLEDLAVDPYPHLAELRSRGAAVWAPNLGMWVVAGYDDAVSVLRDPARFTNDSPKSLIQATFGRQMLSVEGEEQKRHKQACLAPFTGKASREVWQPRVDRLCAGLLPSREEAAPSGAVEVDLMADYAAPIALETMGIVVGLPSGDLPRVRAWYEVLARSLANFEGDADVHRAGQEAAAAMREYLAERLDRQRPAGETGDGTLLEVLSGPGGTLTRAEVLANLLIVLFGGIETTESMIGNALHYLLSEPGLLAATLDSRNQGEAAFLAAIEDVMEESLRYDPAVQTLTRHTTDGRPHRRHGDRRRPNRAVHDRRRQSRPSCLRTSRPLRARPGERAEAPGVRSREPLLPRSAASPCRDQIGVTGTAGALAWRRAGPSVLVAAIRTRVPEARTPPGAAAAHLTASRPKRITVRRRSGLSELSQTASHLPDSLADGSSSSVG